MNITLRFFIAAFCLVPLFSAQAAVQIKKAAPVATKPSAGTESAASLVPTVLGLVSGVMEMNAKQKALSAECVPSSAERTFVDNMIKEWAKAGASPEAFKNALKDRVACGNNGTSGSYETNIQHSAEGLQVCYNSYKESTDKGMIWYEFPKTGIATYCKE
ncbi:MAG: hypothetical protein LBF28_02890, partial [Rickettsiales bacterium]|nr:hypothetical protein [Rickettsiales bacterium]